MKTKNSFKPLFFGLLFFSFVIVVQSCNDEKEFSLTEQEEQEMVEYGTLADNTIDEELQAIEEIESETAEGRRKTANNCVIITRDTTSKTVTLDFGNGCTGPYGNKRSGKIIITYGGTFGDEHANRVITFENYFVNNKQIEGTIRLRNFNLNNEGKLTATRELEDYTITFPNGHAYVLNGSVTRVWLEGAGDDIIGNEVIEVTGSWKGSYKNREFTRTITEPIIADFACRISGGFLRVDGKEEIVISKMAKERTRTLDYGDGSCDNQITVTINEKTKIVTVNE